MIHYHGGPITPDTCAIKAWHARHAFISHAHPQQIDLASEICQSFALDNGAFSAWKAGRPMDLAGYYRWVERWVTHPGFDFAVVPDVIAGTMLENDMMLRAWPFPKWLSAVVWHVNEPIERFVELCTNYPRVCIGSSGDFDVQTPNKFLIRAKTALAAVCDINGQPMSKIHGLRMLNPKIFGSLPLASADSTNVAYNIKMDRNWQRGNYMPKSRETRSAIMVERIEHENSASALDWHSWGNLCLMRNMAWAGTPISIVASLWGIETNVMSDICVP